MSRSFETDRYDERRSLRAIPGPVKRESRLHFVSFSFEAWFVSPLSEPDSHLFETSDDVRRPLRVCVVALNAYPAIDPDVPGGFGGIETRSWLFARALAQQPNCEVTFVVRHWQRLRQDVYEGVRLVLTRDRLYYVRDSILSRISRKSQFPWVNLKHPTLSDVFWLPILAIGKLFRAKHDPRESSPFFERIPADLFLTFGVQSHSATVIASAQATGRPAVLFLGSDSDLDERYTHESEFVSIYRDRADVCRWVLQEADAILCQTERQQQRLQELFHRSGTVVRNPIDIAQWDLLAEQEFSVPVIHGLARYLLWIGRADATHKQPQVMIEVARQIPDVPVVMVMNPRDDMVDAEVRAAAPPNVRIVDKVPFDWMPLLFRQACCLVNTSSLEGFPNTFLQAAISGVPIASLNVEPEFLNHAQAGFCAAGDLEKLIEYTRKVVGTPPPVITNSPAREYVARHHALATQSRELTDALHGLIKASSTAN